MHTILISRGSVEQRIQLKKMLEGELFLEELHEDPTDVNKTTGVNIWACPADGQPPFNILEKANKAFEEHELSYNTRRGIRGPDDPQFNYDIENPGGINWDPKLHPHGATAVPTRNRLTSYNENSRLVSEHPPAGNNPSPNDYQLVVTLKRLTDDYKALILYVDELENRVNERFKTLLNGVNVDLDQLSEIAAAINNDKDFVGWVRNELAKKVNITNHEADKAAIRSEITAQITVVDNTKLNRYDDPKGLWRCNISSNGGHQIQGYYLLNCTANTP